MSEQPYDWAPGSTVDLLLDVTPADGTTTATVALVGPTDTTTAPSVSGVLTGSTWDGTARVVLGLAGVWTARWTVTGTGEGVRQRTISVGPTMPTTARSYATTTDLANWTGTAPPDGAIRSLRRATGIIDDLLITAIYDVDADGLPTDADVIAALRDATCEQVAWWIETGDETGAQALYASVSIGSVSLSRGPGASGSSASSSRISPDAAKILRRAGLLGHGPWAR